MVPFTAAGHGTHCPNHAEIGGRFVTTASENSSGGAALPKRMEAADTGQAVSDTTWIDLASAPTDAAHFAAWAEILGRHTGADAVVLVLGPADRGPFQRAGEWPAGTETDDGMTEALNLSLAQRKPIVKSGLSGVNAGRCAVAAPVIDAGALAGAVALRLPVTAGLDLRAAMREVQWALPGVALRLSERRSDLGIGDQARVRTALELLASTLEQPRFGVACSTAVTELADALECDRVAIGFRRRLTTKVAALSHSGNFGRRAELVQQIADAMDEAIDQRATICLPAASGNPLLVSAAHANLSERGRRSSVATAPMLLGDRLVGAITLERPWDQGFSSADIETLEVVAGVLGPVLEEKRLNDRPLVVKLFDSLLRGIGAILGPRRLGLKLVLVAGAAGLVALWQVPGEFRVTAEARIEGSVLRVVAAPLDGYVMSSSVRPGDIVAEGDIMARLDDREIALELRRWQTVRDQRQREYEKALSERDPGLLGIVGTQISQAEAEIALLDERMARTTMASPFDGIVLAGDLGTSVGTPVSRGDVLFEIAPLDAYRVILSVDEHDIAAVTEGQTATLVLTALPGQTHEIRTQRLTSVASVEDGKNVFRVEAEMIGDLAPLRPGMKGLAKILIDERPLIEIWSRNTVNWLRLALWRWLP